MELEELLEKIQNLEIQGATEIALESVKALERIDKEESTREDLEEAKEKILDTRPTEPALRNALNYAIETGRFEEVKKHLKNSRQEVAEKAAELIEDKENIYTHCHSTTVMEAIKENKNPETTKIHNTETRPLFQGRKTAKELAGVGFKVIHHVDAAAKYALNESEVMIIGSDAIDSKGNIYNKIGSEMIAELAEREKVPVFVLTDSWKFDPRTINGEKVPIERRNSKEVWKNPPGNVEIHNPAFERVDRSFIDRIVTETGIIQPEEAKERFRKEYPELL
ncbi:MAG: hypothetical protein MUP58_03805 [Candidatus Nanohaloarchaeota archaeon QJJ-9]|nr:hypothetical protein [Candidatus Nanohaloarchaeota archaeon QJJ-9]